MSIRQRLAAGFDPTLQRRVKRLWVRHSIAEDRRDIDGLIATLAPECVYEIVGSGLRWQGHDGARAFYTALFADEQMFIDRTALGGSVAMLDEAATGDRSTGA
jgi:SnoaL-like protein